MARQALNMARREWMIESNGISIIIPLTERHDDLQGLFDAYSQALVHTGRPLQFIFVLDGGFSQLAEELCSIDPQHHSIEVVPLSRTFGESTALTIGFDRAIHDLVMTLPAYQQVEADHLPTLIDAISDADMVVARRWPRHDSRLNQFSGRLFHFLVRAVTHTGFRDIGCSVRLIRRKVLEEVTIYGDQHRFFPILADRKGFRVVEQDLPQASAEASLRVYRPGVYLSRLIDLMGVFFVVRFTKKPLRFFGIVGSVLMSAGAMILIIAVMQRYFMSIALSDRPILLLGSLFVVLGAQLFAVGLIGELIIFTHARDLKEYAVGETVNFDHEQRECESEKLAQGEEKKS